MMVGRFMGHKLSESEMNEEFENDSEESARDQDSQETVPVPSEPPTEAVPVGEREDMEELRRKAAEYEALLDRLKRVTADFLNTQKRIERQAEERVAYAVERFAEELLPVADNLARAVDAAEQAGATGPLLDGVSLVRKQLMDVFKNHGIEMIKASVGDVFDANFHEAIAAVPMTQMEPNRIVEIHHHGFLLRGRLLRATRVIVSRRPDSEQGS